MKKKVEIPTNNPLQGPGHGQETESGSGQRPSNNTRGDIMKKTTDSFNNNNGPKQRSRKKTF